MSLAWWSNPCGVFFVGICKCCYSGVTVLILFVQGMTAGGVPVETRMHTAALVVEVIVEQNQASLTVEVSQGEEGKQFY